MRDHLRRLVREAEACGLDRVRIEHQGQPHPRLVGELAGQPFAFVVGGSVHTRGRAVMNAIAELRRAIRKRMQSITVN